MSLIEIDNVLVSMDVIKQQFCCHLPTCKGTCCIEGISGAPLEEQEKEQLKKVFPVVKKYLKEKSLQSIIEQGVYVIDNDGDTVTPLIDGKECVYSFFENGIAQCAIEKAFFSNQISFRKPISCHLYPIRVKKLKEYEALNYDQWYLCKPAKLLGKENGIPLYLFLKEALIRKYGHLWFKKLEKVVKNLPKKNELQNHR